MALNPENEYPGRIDPGSPDYPFGAARNITAPGSGDGTPWEAALVNDLFGFQQAIISEAGFVPSGDPETATNSQYLEGIKALTLGTLSDSPSTGALAVSGASVKVKTMEDLLALPPAAVPADALVTVIDPYEGYGGRQFFWDPSAAKSRHNGWSVLSSTVPWTSNNTDYVDGAGETDPTGNGCWVGSESDDGAVDLFIVYGQSNARGFAGGTAPRLDITPGASYWSREGQEITKLVHDPESTFDDGGRSSGHAWTAFSNHYCRETGRKALFLYGTIGGTTLVELSKGGAIYNAMQSEYAALQSELSSRSVAINNTYVLFHHGETDQQDGTTREDYQDQLLQLIDDLETDFSVDHFYAATVGNPQNRDEISWHVIRSAQEYVYNGVDNASLVFEGCQSFYKYNNFLNTDGVHYTQRGYNLMGLEMAKAVTSAIESGDNETSESLKSYTYPTLVGSGRTRMVMATARITDSGIELLTRDNDPHSISSFVTSVQAGVTDIDFMCQGFRANKVLSAFSEAYDENDSAAQLGTRTSVSVDTVNFSEANVKLTIRLNKDITFAFDSSDGSFYNTPDPTSGFPDLLTSASLSSVEGSAEWAVDHNNSNMPPTVVPVNYGADPDNTARRFEYISKSRFRVAKSSGLYVCHFPGFSIRTNDVKAGASIIVKVFAVVSYDRDGI